MKKLIITALSLILGSFSAAHALPKQCAQSEIAVQILGSGGPIAEGGRASSGNLIWYGGKSIYLIDSGGGIFLRFGEAQAKVEDLESILLTHFHTDHSADLPALIKSAYFSERTRDLLIAGPSGNKSFPGLNEFLKTMFGKNKGVYRYLSEFLDGTDGSFTLKPIEIDIRKKIATLVLAKNNIQVRGVSVAHGLSPSLAYVIEIDGYKMVFSGDQTTLDSRLAKIAQNADLLVFTMAIPEDAETVAKRLHATPSQIADFAMAIKAKQLVLSHLMQRSISSLDTSMKIIKSRYTGKIIIAEDLMCIEVK